MKHKHHVVPVHKGGENGPVVEMNPWDHAELHAKRFLDGEDTWFHGGLLEFLDSELEKKVRSKMSEVISGENHPYYGMKLWSDGNIWVWSKESPGPDFKVGDDGTMSEKLKGMMFWNNGERQIRSRECPGLNWQRGRLPWDNKHKLSFGNTSRGSKWWNNGETTKRSVECPGPGWELGRISWKQVG